MASVDASNACIPYSHPVVKSSPPLPSTTRGEPCLIDGRCGRLNADKSVLLYTSSKLVIVRHVNQDLDGREAFVYRGHTAPVTAARFAPSGCYVASADSKGKLRVWSYDNEEHLCKLDLVALAGPIRDISWDLDSKRICIVGERLDASSECTRAIQWDTGVTVGELGQHTRGRASSCDFKPNRPMRIVTGGKDDSKCLFNAGPPFKRVVDGTPAQDVHTKGAVNCVRFSPDGSKIVSVGSDKTVAIYQGKTMELITKKEDVHGGTIYSCAWSMTGTHILTCSSDGYAKLLSAESLEVVDQWNVAEEMKGSPLTDGVPIGAMVVGCAFIKDDVPVTVSINGEICLLPKPAALETGINTFQRLTGHNAPIAGLAIDHPRAILYTGDTDGVLCQWDLTTLKATKRLIPPQSTNLLGKVHGEAALSCLAVTGNGSLLSGGWDDTVRVVGTNGEFAETPVPLEAQPNGMTRGTELVAVLTVGGVVLLKDGNPISALLPLEAPANAIALSPDDSTIYVGGQDCKIYVYTVTDGTELEKKHVIEGAHLKPIHSLSLSHDGTKLASADVRDVCVFNTEDFSSIVGKSRWCFHTQRITCLAWSPDDTILASGGADDSIYLWSLAKKMKRQQYSFAHRGGVTGLSFLREGLTLVSVGVDACVNQWDVQDDVAKKFG